MNLFCLLEVVAEHDLSTVRRDCTMPGSGGGIRKQAVSTLQSRALIAEKPSRDCHSLIHRIVPALLSRRLCYRKVLHAIFIYKS